MPGPIRPLLRQDEHGPLACGRCISGLPGLGLDINEAAAAKYPMADFTDGGAYKTDRGVDGKVIWP